MIVLRVALAQLNTTAGDLDGNADRIVAWARRAAGAQAHLVVLPEAALTGHLVEEPAAPLTAAVAAREKLERTARRLAAEGLGGLPVLTGCPHPADGDGPDDQRAPSAAAVLHDGRVVVRPAGPDLPVFRLHGVDVAVAVGADLCGEGGSAARVRESRAGLLVTLDATPYERGRHVVRRRLCERRAQESGAVVAHCNLVGGQDESVFDGGSLIVGPNGELLARAAQFEEELLVADLDLAARVARGEQAPVLPWLLMPGLAEFAPKPTRLATPATVLSLDPAPPVARPARRRAARPLDPLGEVYAALVLGVRDYAGKNGFRGAVLGLFGGADCALVATVAADALGPDRVHAVLLPSRSRGEHCATDADELVRRQGLRARTVPIHGIVDAFEAELDLHGLAVDDLQARVRGTVWTALADEDGHLVLATGNKSEIAAGRSTPYGDSAGGYAPLKDVPGALVRRLCRWRNARTGPMGGLLHPFGVPPVPEAVIDEPSSGERQPASGEVPEDFAAQDFGPEAPSAAGHGPLLTDRVIRLVDRAEYQRRPYPPGPKITTNDSGPDRRPPITSGWREPAGRGQGSNHV